MKRSPIVLGGTAMGLVGVLGYHAAAKPSTLASAGSTTTQATTSSSSSAKSTSSAKTSATHSATTSATQTRSATGEDVSYQYGDIAVKVTMSGSRIADVSIARLDVNDAHSQEIDQGAIPQLEQETRSAQSAKIDAVSGASYTSQAYEQSLQSALDKLGTSSTAS